MNKVILTIYDYKENSRSKNKVALEIRFDAKELDKESDVFRIVAEAIMLIDKKRREL